MVLRPKQVRINRRLRRTIRNRSFLVTLDTAFRQVIEECAVIPRKNEQGTWITKDMIEAYTELHHLGFAHSAECWLGDELVGGLYGVSVGTVMIGESMFARVSDASKVAFVATLKQLERWKFDLVDAQIHTAHLASLGAREWPRDRFLNLLRKAVENETRYGPWQIDPDLQDLRAYN
jgi:leucyl/phenylalanyl-tRNA--protein transferase